ncbi:MAG: DUF5675 family protein [Flavobacteriaceae bacterium]|nr:DUF5675 family protein [Flavobacteriaceae bacterium]
MTLGVFKFGTMEGYICEPFGPETTERGKDKRIPAGIYNIKWHNFGRYLKDVYTKNGRIGKKHNLNYSELKKGVIKLYNDKVPESRGILMHAGTHGGWSEGCILPNKSIDKTKYKIFDLDDSIKTVYEIMRKIEELGIENIKIKIIDEIN